MGQTRKSGEPVERQAARMARARVARRISPSRSATARSHRSVSPCVQRTCAGHVQAALGVDVLRRRRRQLVADEWSRQPAETLLAEDVLDAADL